MKYLKTFENYDEINNKINELLIFIINLINNFGIYDAEDYSERNKSLHVLEVYKNGDYVMFLEFNSMLSELAIKKPPTSDDIIYDIFLEILNNSDSVSFKNTQIRYEVYDVLDIDGLKNDIKNYNFKIKLDANKYNV